MTRVQAVIEETKVITSKPIDQSWGAYRPGKACCVGARLANHFDVADLTGTDYRKGMKAFAKALGGNIAHVITMFRLAGAGHDPFSGDRWPIPPEEVWHNLKQFEQLPDLRGECFNYEIFMDQTFDNVDLSHMAFTGCRMTDVTFKDCVIHFTTFSAADMHRSKWAGCDIEDCNFNNTSLVDADFRGATIRGCQFKNAETSGILFDASHYDTEFNNDLPYTEGSPVAMKG